MSNDLRMRAPAALLALVGALILAGCASGPRGGSGGSGGGSYSGGYGGASGGGGGRDGAPRNPPAGLENLPDAQPRVEPIRTSGGTSKPYTVLGRSYRPITDDRAHRETGLASWYGTGFHAQSTASGEPYDMYAMTAAHKTLPLPSYVRVRNPANGREAIVRVNDRGPFHDDRIIDLSYAAASRLDLLRGVAPVEIERITNEDIRTGAWRRPGDTQLASATPAPMAAAAPTAMPVAAGAVGVAGAAGAPNAAYAAPARRPPGVLVAQAAPAPAPEEPPTLSDTAPPPRFGGMEVNNLAPMAPVSPPPSALPAPPAGGATGATAATATSAGTAATPGSAAPSPTGAPPSAAGDPGAPAPGFWVQLGAFREATGAVALQDRTAQSVPALARQLRLFSDGGTHRLQAGPFASRQEADDTVATLRERLQLAPIVVERR